MTSERTAVGYVRLSQQSDRSLATQRTDIRDYCNQSELSLVEIYNEGEGASGYDNDREEYTRMLSYVQEHEIDAVVVRDHARLSRDRKERLRLLLDLDTAGVDLHSVERGEAVNLDEDWAYVLQAIQATTDDVEKRKEIERSKQETQRRVEAGHYQGRPPLGTRFDAAGEGLIPDPEEWPTIMDAFELLDQGESYRSITETTSTWILEADDTADAIIEQSRYYELTILGAPTKHRLAQFVDGSTNRSIRSNARSVILSVRNNTTTSTLYDH